MMIVARLSINCQSAASIVVCCIHWCLQLLVYHMFIIMALYQLPDGDVFW